MDQSQRGLCLFLGQIVLFAADTVFIHQIGSGASVMQLALIRNVGLLIIAIWIFGKPSLAIFYTERLVLQILRAALSVTTMWLVVFSFTHLELSEATAISYTQAIFLTLFTATLLGERVPTIRWISLCIGFLGTLMMVRPVFSTFQLAYIGALLAAACNALVFVVSKPLQKADSTATLLMYVSTFGILCNLPDLFIHPWPERSTWPWMVGMLLAGPLGQVCGILAVRHTDISLLAPWLYLRLVLASAFGGALFHEIPSIWSLAGATVVFISCGLTLNQATLPKMLNRRQA